MCLNCSGVPAVRLYQDALFVKRPGDGETQWHSDLNTAPFDTNDFVTCWLPLHPVPCEVKTYPFPWGTHIFA